MHNNIEKNLTSNSQVNIEDLLSYFEIKTMDLSGERALWQSVIMQAVLDAIVKPKNIKEKMQRAKTISWFSHANEDFMLVCSFANLSPDFIIEGVRKIIKKNKKPYYPKYRTKNKILEKKMRLQLKKSPSKQICKAS
jgi:hypothetical protein